MQMMEVRELPPSARSRMRVRFESRKGTCWLVFLLFTISESREITFERQRSDLLMLAPSFSRCPVACEFRGGLVVKAHRWVYHSTLGSGVIKRKKKACEKDLRERSFTCISNNRGG